MYYLIKPDGTSVFEQGYPFDFIMHCLFSVIDSPDPFLSNLKVLLIDTSGRLCLVQPQLLTVR